MAEELPALVDASLPVDPERAGIFGHSMGGHGALTIALKHPDRFRSVSAFAPIASPMRCPWGEKALGGYLGADREAWRAYDATALIADRGWRGPPILVDQGTQDAFVDTQLKPELLREACAAAGVPLDLRYREGYDHSYFFIATFIEEHLRYHAANGARAAIEHRLAGVRLSQSRLRVGGAQRVSGDDRPWPARPPAPSRPRAGARDVARRRSRAPPTRSSPGRRGSR